MARLRVLIAGSTHFKGSDDVREAFKDCCVEIGAALAKAGIETIIGSNNEDTADCYVFEGIRSVKNHPPVTVVRPESGGDSLNQLREEHNVIFRRGGKGWVHARIHQVQAADVVLAIGGGSGTDTLTHTAIALRRPVLPIASFGGTVKELHSSVKSDFKTDPALQDVHSELGEPWIPGTGGRIPGALALLKAKNPYREPGLTDLIAILALVICIPAAWALTLHQSRFNALYTLFTILPLAAGMGVVLRSGLRRFAAVDARVNWRTVLVELSVGIPVAFGLALVYLAGGLAINGNVDFAMSTADSDLMRVGIAMSIIGFGSGFLIERFVKRLKELLSRLLDTDRDVNT